MKRTLSGLMLCLPFLACSLMVWALPLAPDFDLYLHLKTGETIWGQGSLPGPERFSYASQGGADETHSWLSQVIFFGMNHALGEAGIRLLVLAALFASLLLAMGYVLRRTDSSVLAALAGCFTLLLEHRMQVFRPLLLGQLCFCVLVFELLSELRPLSMLRYVGCLFLLALWANLHGSVLVSLPVVMLYSVCLWFSREEKGVAKSPWFWPSIALPVAAVFAIALNPAGFNLYRVAWELSQVGKISGIFEWQSAFPLVFYKHFPPPHEIWVGLDARNLMLWVSLPFSAYCLWRAFVNHSPRRMFDSSLAMLFLCLAMVSFRHTLFMPYSITALLTLAFVLWGNAAKTWGHRHLSKRVEMLAPMVLCLAILASGKLHQSGYVATSLDKSMDFLTSVGVKGNVFSFPDWGSYLIYRGYPDLKVAVDRRLWVHRNFYRESAAQLEAFGGIDYADFVARYPETDFVVFHTYSPVVKTLGEKQWLTVFENNLVNIAIRRNERNAENLKKIESYYSQQGVAFNPEEGFVTAKVAASSPDWFASHQELARWGRFPEPEIQRAWVAEQKQYLRRLERQPAKEQK